MIYPEDGGIKRFPGYVENGVRHILLQFLMKYWCIFIKLPYTWILFNMHTLIVIYIRHVVFEKMNIPDCNVVDIIRVFDHSQVIQIHC